MRQSHFIITCVILLAGCTASADQSVRIYVVNNRVSNASNDNPGTQARPMRTIQAAADLAKPGDTVLVRAGIYREEVVPPRGGASQDRPITYRAAPGEKVSIRGSERITNWRDQSDGVWMVELDTAFFNGYNPFAIPVAGEWLFRGKDRRLGDVYCDGEALLQKIKFDQMKATPKTWYTDLKYGFANKFDFPANRQYPDNKIQIWANFGDVNPNIALTETASDDIKKPEQIISILNECVSCSYIKTLPDTHFTKLQVEWHEMFLEMNKCLGRIMKHPKLLKKARAQSAES